MLQQAGQDDNLMKTLQEAASAAGFELELRPKTSGEGSAPSSPSKAAAPSVEPDTSAIVASSPSDDSKMDKLRAETAKSIVQASTDGSFLQALEEASEEAAAEATLLPQKLERKFE